MKSLQTKHQYQYATDTPPINRQVESIHLHTQRKRILATPNYGYEKRQKELAKKKKKEEKLKSKTEKKSHPDGSALNDSGVQDQQPPEIAPVG